MAGTGRRRSCAGRGASPRRTPPSWRPRARARRSGSAGASPKPSPPPSSGGRRCILGITADRTSNGPHIYYPDGGGPGGRGTTEDWVWDNFQRDPYAEASPTVTAENVAREQGISRPEQDEVALVRYEQYVA